MDKKNKIELYRDFNIDLDKDYIIWCTYHNEDQVKKYNLHDDKHTRLFNTTNIGYEGKSLNHLNRFLSELVGILYPWMNNLRSDYIGFRHYRRIMRYDKNILDFKKYDNGYVQYFELHQNCFLNIENNLKREYHSIEDHCRYWNAFPMHYDDIVEFLTKYYSEFLEGEKRLHCLYARCIFISNWDIYCKICEFLYRYIEFINNKYRLEWSEHKWYDHIVETYVSKMVDVDPKELYMETFNSNLDFYRIYSYDIEFLLSIYIYNNKHFLDENNQLEDL